MLLYFVFLDEMSNTFIIHTSSSRMFPEKSWLKENTLVCSLLGLQIIFASLQSGFSDYYLRRKSLIVSISATLLSLLLLKFSIDGSIWFLIFSVILKGMLGNTLPLAWAGIADETHRKNIRFFLALSICALAIGSWSSLLTIPLLPSKFFCILIILAIILGLFATYFYSDPEDIPHDRTRIHVNEKACQTEDSKKNNFLHLVSKDFFSLYRLWKNPLNFLALNAFLFSEISFYQILFRVEILHNYRCFLQVPLAIGLGYTAGTVALKFIKAKDQAVSSLGLAISVIAILLMNVIFSFGHTDQIILFTTLFSLYSFGFALFTPSLFSIITIKENLHAQGKYYGLLESTDGLASLITFILVFHSKNMSCSSVLNTSSIILLICSIIFLFVLKKDAKHQKG